MRLDPQGQVQRIQRNTAPASELVRVKVQTKGGQQTMPAITLRGFSPRVLGMNPNEVKSNNPIEDEERATYYENLALWARWKADQYAQRWRGQMEARIESNEAISRLLPEIIERLGPETITPEHHQQVKTLAKQLHLATGKTYPTIYDELKTVFEKGRIEDLLEEEWEQVEKWFRVQIENARGKTRRS